MFEPEAETAIIGFVMLNFVKFLYYWKERFDSLGHMLIHSFVKILDENIDTTHIWEYGEQEKGGKLQAWLCPKVI